MPMCRQCRTAEYVRRAHSSILDRFLALFRIKPFRCEMCWSRFYGFPDRERDAARN